jgi:hypothetical protein
MAASPQTLLLPVLPILRAMSDDSKPPPPVDLDAAFHALGDPAARHMLELVALAPRDVSDLMGHFSLKPNDVIAIAAKLEAGSLVRLAKRRSVVVPEPSGLVAVRSYLDAVERILSGAPP